MLRLAPLLLGLAVLAAACTTTDPYTGEQRVDPLPTAAAVAGAAALGALVWSASDRDDDDDGRYRSRRYRRPFSPARHVHCFPEQRRCYNEGDFSKRWTRRVFGD